MKRTRQKRKKKNKKNIISFLKNRRKFRTKKKKITQR